MIAPEVLEALKEAGATVDMILAAIRADAALADKATEERRARDRERQRRHRMSRDVTVTRCDRRDPSPKDINQTPNQVLPTKPSGLEPKQRKHRLPANWQPEPLRPGTVTGDIVARWPEGKFERELEKFRDHHTAAGTRHENWQAALRKWVSNAEEFERGRNGGQYRSSVGKSAAAFAALNLRDGDTF